MRVRVRKGQTNTFDNGTARPPDSGRKWPRTVKEIMMQHLSNPTVPGGFVLVVFGMFKE